MQEETRPIYICEFCKTPYENKQLALKCEEHYKNIEKYKDLEWVWVHLQSRYSDATKYVFTPKIEIVSGYSESCLRKTIECRNTYYSDYYEIPKNWSILETLSLENAFEKLHMLPRFFAVSDSAIPPEVRKRIDTLYEKRNELAKKEMMSLSKDELIEKLLPFYTHPFRNHPNRDKYFDYNT